MMATSTAPEPVAKLTRRVVSILEMFRVAREENADPRLRERV